MEIYIKPVKKIVVEGRRTIYLKDLAEVVADTKTADKLKNLKLLEMKAEKKANYLVSVTDIVRAISAKFPNDTVSNLGEADTVVEFSPVKERDNSVWKWTKIVFVALVLLAGSATAIMSFHSDAQMPEVFKNYYKVFFGKEIEKPLLIDIPYSIGLAAGIIVFFNHFMGKKVTEDPTPIEIEMALYETDVTDTVKDTLADRRAHEGDKNRDGTN
ncbi:MAG: stage V sporulation protein AA [Defluviitaleaceae bacterium]|nr:stage V sporulation protein AA [Defluviitaleaceae bacterium]